MRITKSDLLRMANGLPPIPQVEHPFIACGDQSVVCENGLDKVLLITRFTVASNIELLRAKLAEKPEGALLFDIPILKAIDVDLGKIIHPTDNKKSKLVKSLNVINNQLWKQNVVYELPRYNNTLDDLKSIRFNAMLIDLLDAYLQKATAYLHYCNLSHNDISAKNIFISGIYPHYSFHLGDLGSLTENNIPKQHAHKCEIDLIHIKRLIANATVILAEKNALSEEGFASFEKLPFLNQKRREKLALSPLKSPLVANKKEVRTSSARAKLKF